MPQETKSKDAPQQEATSLQGLIASADDEQALLGALENAFDYRGDVTIEQTDGERIEGYIFDRVRGRSLQDSFVRILPKDSDERATVAFSTIAKLEFTGKDTAAGKSFDAWVQRYIERKLAGKEASIASEPLED